MTKKKKIMSIVVALLLIILIGVCVVLMNNRADDNADKSDKKQTEQEKTDDEKTKAELKDKTKNKIISTYDEEYYEEHKEALELLSDEDIEIITNSYAIFESPEDEESKISRMIDKKFDKNYYKSKDIVTKCNSSKSDIRKYANEVNKSYAKLHPENDRFGDMIIDYNYSGNLDEIYNSKTYNDDTYSNSKIYNAEKLKELYNSLDNGEMKEFEYPIFTYVEYKNKKYYDINFSNILLFKPNKFTDEFMSKMISDINSKSNLRMRKTIVCKMKGYSVILPEEIFVYDNVTKSVLNYKGSDISEYFAFASNCNSPYEFMESYFKTQGSTDIFEAKDEIINSYESYVFEHNNDAFEELKSVFDITNTDYESFYFDFIYEDVNPKFSYFTKEIHGVNKNNDNVVIYESYSVDPC